MEKAQIRAQVQAAVAAIAADDQAAYSRGVCDKVIRLPEYEEARIIMAYATMKNELDVSRIVRHALGTGKIVLMPKSVRRPRRMMACPITSLDADLRPGTFGILEPVTDVSYEPDRIDFMVVPGCAFDSRCNRLGRGGGYYDRFMSSSAFHAFKCGVAFDAQLMDGVPHDAHDLPVDVVVTERREVRPHHAI